MDPDARAAWTGLSLAHTRAHLIRAVLEGVAYGLNDGVVRMRALGVDPAEFIATGNGMSSDLWRGIIGAVFDRPLRRLLVDEGPAFGAALLAAVGAGLFSSVESAADAAVELASHAEVPREDLVQAYRAGYERFTHLYPALLGAQVPRAAQLMTS
jgi:xylulokinase